MTGTLINVLLVVIGSLIGVTLRQKLPTKYGRTLLQGIALFVLYLGWQMAQETTNSLIPLFSIIGGAIIGEAIDIEARLNRLSNRLEKRYSRGDDQFTKAFVGSSLLFIVGPMAILGSINDGLYNDSSLLIAKSMMDGFSSIAFASTMGIGVLFSALPILVYQGSLTLGAILVKDFFTPQIIAEMTATGGLLILGIGINMLEIGKIAVGNLLPAIPLAVLGTFLLNLIA
ncbi:MAG: DUF554 domain-containing protein [Limnochordia bacterium]